MNGNSSNYYSVEEMVNLFVAKDECFMFYNVRSFSRNFYELFFDCLYDNDSLDKIGLCETWIGEDYNLLGDFQLNNFQFFSVPINCRGGGVALLIKNKYTVTIVEPLSASTPHLEFLFTLVRYNKETSTIGCLYRHLDLDFREFILNLEQHIEFISVNFGNVNKIVIGGDFNIDLLKTSRRSSDYLNMMFSYSLSTAIFRPTRVTSHSVL